MSTSGVNKIHLSLFFSSVYKMNEDYPEEEFDNVTDPKKKKRLSFLKPWMKKSESSDKYEGEF